MPTKFGRTILSLLGLEAKHGASPQPGAEEAAGREVELEADELLATDISDEPLGFAFGFSTVI